MATKVGFAQINLNTGEFSSTNGQIGINAIDAVKLSGTIATGRLAGVVTVAEMNASAVIVASEADISNGSDTALMTEGAVQVLVKNAVEGMDHKDAVIAASDLNLAGNIVSNELVLTTLGKFKIGGQVLLAEDRLLLRKQTASSQNGIFKLKTGSIGSDFTSGIRILSTSIADLDNEFLTITSQSGDAKSYQFDDNAALFNGENTVRGKFDLTALQHAADGLFKVDFWLENDAGAITWPAANTKFQIEMLATGGTSETVFAAAASIDGSSKRRARLYMDDEADDAAVESAIRLLFATGADQALHSSLIPANEELSKENISGGVRVDAACGKMQIFLHTKGSNVAFSSVAPSGHIKIATNGLSGANAIAAKFGESLGRASGFADTIMTHTAVGPLITLTEKAYYNVGAAIGTVAKSGGIATPSEIDDGAGGNVNRTFSATQGMVFQRTDDAAQAGELESASVWVKKGDNADKAYIVAGTMAGVPGATGGTGDHTWNQWSAGAQLTFGTGLVRVNNAITPNFKRYDGVVSSLGAGWSSPDITDISANVAAEKFSDPEWAALNSDPQTMVIFNGLVLEPAVDSAGVGTNGDYYLGGSAGAGVDGRLDIKIDTDLINQATSDKISIVIPLPSA